MLKAMELYFSKIKKFQNQAKQFFSITLMGHSSKDCEAQQNVVNLL